MFNCMWKIFGVNIDSIYTYCKIICLLFPLTNSVCLSSCACCRNFSFLLDCPLTASRGLTNIRSRIILRKIPEIVKNPLIIMTSRQQTLRKNSFRRAVAKRLTLNGVNVSRIVLIIHKYTAERIPWNQQVSVSLRIARSLTLFLSVSYTFP